MTRPHGHLKMLIARELHGPHHVSNIDTAGDSRRIFVNHAIPHPAGVVIGFIARHDQFAMEVGFEVL